MVLARVLAVSTLEITLTGYYVALFLRYEGRRLTHSIILYPPLSHFYYHSLFFSFEMPKPSSLSEETLEAIKSALTDPRLKIYKFADICRSAQDLFGESDTPLRKKVKTQRNNLLRRSPQIYKRNPDQIRLPEGSANIIRQIISPSRARPQEGSTPNSPQDNPQGCSSYSPQAPSQEGFSSYSPQAPSQAPSSQAPSSLAPSQAPFQSPSQAQRFFSKMPTIYDRAWAERNKDIVCFDLNFNEPWKNEYITLEEIPSIQELSDNGKTVALDGFRVELPVSDITDIKQKSFQAILSADGDGLFIKMPWVRSSYYNNVKKQHNDGGSDFKPVSIQHYTAHATTANIIKKHAKDKKHTRLLFYRFPEDFFCNNSHFNPKAKKYKNDQALDLKLKYVTVPMPKLKLSEEMEEDEDADLDNKLPKTQVIPSVSWEMVVEDSLKEVDYNDSDNSDSDDDIFSGARMRSCNIGGK